MPHVHQKGILCHVAHSHSCLGHNSLRACKVGRQGWVQKRLLKTGAEGSRAAFQVMPFLPAFLKEYLPVRWGALGCWDLLSKTRMWRTIGVDKSFMTFPLPVYSKTVIPGSSAAAPTGLHYFLPVFPNGFNCGQHSPLLIKTGWGNAILCSAMTIFTEEMVGFLQ